MARKSGSKSSRRNSGGDYSDGALADWLRSHSVEQLTDLLLDICREHPDIADDLTTELKLVNGESLALMRDIRKEAEALMEGPDWDDYNGAPPDYSKLLNKMEQVLPLGAADELLDLMPAFLDAALEQMALYDRNGEYADEIGPCFETAVDILRASTLDPAEKLMWAIDRSLADDYDLANPLDQYLAEKHPAENWSEVADALLARLESSKPAEQDRHHWGRDSLSNWAIYALEESGRESEIIPLCEREAGLTQSYERLVRRLMEAGRTEAAESYIERGIAETYKSLPGIASSLRKMRTKLHSGRQDWDLVLSHQVCEFVESPTISTYKDVKQAAEKLNRWPEVRVLLLSFLQSGTAPWRQASWDWPEPDQVELMRDERWKKSFPQVEALIRIAILEKEPAEVLRWHDRLPAGERRGFGAQHLDLDVAEAVKKQAPERALAIWKRLAEAEIAQTKPVAYETAGGYLQKAGRLMTSLKREAEWHDYLNGLRAANKRKRRLMEVLDGL